MTAKAEIAKAELAARKQVILDRVKHWLEHAKSVVMDEMPTTRPCVGSLHTDGGNSEPAGGIVLQIICDNYPLPCYGPKFRRVRGDVFEIQEQEGAG